MTFELCVILLKTWRYIMDQECIFDVTNLRFEGDFSEQVTEILNYIRLTREEVMDLQLLYKDLEMILQERWRGSFERLENVKSKSYHCLQDYSLSGEERARETCYNFFKSKLQSILILSCKVIPFGSIVTGMGIKTSDVDCFVDLHLNGTNKSLIRRNIMIARNVLAASPLIERPFAIVAAKVPIVQFNYLPINRKCDINLSSRAGTRNSQLISFLLQLDDRALPLAILLKYWSKVYDLTGTNKLSNYALILIIIFYLQQVKILPSVMTLQKLENKCCMVDDWDTSFVSSLPGHQTENSTTLLDLLGGFFEYYSNFNFNDNIISTFVGRTIHRSNFATNKIPIEFELYCRNLVEKNLNPLRMDTNICIQDPFEHNRNCTVALPIKLEFKFKALIALGADIYRQCSSSDSYRQFLKELLTRVPERVPRIQTYKTFSQHAPPKQQILEYRTATNPRHIAYNPDVTPNKIVKRKKKKAPAHLKNNLGAIPSNQFTMRRQIQFIEHRNYRRFI